MERLKEVFKEHFKRTDSDEVYLDEKILREELKQYCPKHADVPPLFKDIAHVVLDGYFSVKNVSTDEEIKVYPTCVEIYCHDEMPVEDGQENEVMKDYIVYHRNSKSTPAKPVFQWCVLHNHVSGIDITFEHGRKGHEKEAIRLSALIREYKVEKNGKTIKNEKHPTHLYDDLYSQYPIVDGFSVQWKDGKDDHKELTEEPRVNVYEYEKPKNSRGTYIKKAQTEGKKKGYVADKRAWKFTK